MTPMGRSSGELFYWVANWNLSRAGAALLLGGRVDDMIDCTHRSLEAGNVLLAAGHVKRWAGYVTGSSDVRWTSADWRRPQFADCAMVRIDQSNLDLPLLAEAKTAKDVESGASTVWEAVEVSRQRISAGHDAAIYVDQAELRTVEAAWAQTGEKPGRIVAYQYASPTSDPDLPLPGASLIPLSLANCDLSVVAGDWLTPPAPADRDLTYWVTIDPDDGTARIRKGSSTNA